MPSKARILAVDDSPDTLEVIERHLKAEGYHVVPVPGVVEAARALDVEPVDLVITDLRMPRGSGIDLIRHVRANLRNVGIIMLTGYASIPNAVEVMQEGADSYLEKPFTENELLEAVAETLEKTRRLQINRQPPRELLAEPSGLLGNSPAMDTVKRTILKASQTDATVLICGESGTGKELVARAIHYQNVRQGVPFIPVNCAGIPDGLLESELFGYRKGAFTGATETRTGFFHAAEGGSIFFDEIGELSMPMQAVLLRTLQDKAVCMIGAREARKVNVRILAATNRNLEDRVASGQFRQDLYYRLHVLTIEMPPLREREDDILLLIRHFLERFARELHKPPPHFTERALATLRAYPWPGNVRELENIIQRLVLMTEEDTIDTPDLPELMRYSALKGKHPPLTLADLEMQHIREVLTRVGGNKTQAARILGIDRKTLRHKLSGA